MDISLWYFYTNRKSGVGSYTANLYHALVQAGHDVEVYGVRGPLSSTQESSKERDFGYGIKFRTLSLEDAITVMKRTIGMMTVSSWRGYFVDNRKAITALVSMGCHVVVHDKYGIEGNQKGFVEVMKEYKSLPIVIRKAGIAMMKNIGLDAIYIPHPYIRLKSIEERYNMERSVHAVSLTRFDYWKNPHWVILANENLPDHLKVHMWGYHQKSFMKKEIIGKYKGWDDEKYCTGPMYPKEQRKFPAHRGFAVDLTNKSSFLVDMSSLKGDGGGTQYTLLEAMDGGAVPILHGDWVHAPNSVLEDDVNCISVGNPEELAFVLKELDWESCLDIVDANCDLLDKHSPEVIIPMYEDFLRKYS